MKHILVLGAGGAPSTNFVRSLKKKKRKYRLIGTDANPYYLARSETDRTYLVPKVTEADFFPRLNAIIAKEKIDYVHIQNDKEVGVISEQREKVNTKLFLPSKETIRICQDKYLSYQKWEHAKLPLPKTVKINTPKDLTHALQTFHGETWLRFTQGASGNGSLKVNDEKTAKSWIDFHQGWGNFTAAEVLEPNSVTWMSIWKNGELLVAQGRKRLYWEMAHVSPSGITGVTGGAVTVSDPIVDDIAQKAIRAIDPSPHGLYGVDLTYDKNGIPNPTEINIGRFFYTHFFFTELGLNMPAISVAAALNEKLSLPKQRINPLEPGWVWIRGVDFKPILIRQEKIVYEKNDLL